MYDDFMLEYIKLGHMTEMSESDLESTNCTFLPHHAVLREQSTTTKLRVVFNASSNTRSGVSLNDTLLTGPRLQNDLSHILTNWRQHRFVLIADIEKMFRQILVQECDRQFQCILWRKAGDRKVRAFKLNTVTYGTRPAPFLANRAIKAVIQDHSTQFPLAVEPLQRSIYVDDVLIGANSKQSVLEIRDQVIEMLKAGAFNLRKWASNSVDLIPGSQQPESIVGIEPEEGGERKILGIAWSPKIDSFSIQTVEIANAVITKRSILSDTARFFDPLGWLSPIIIRAKLLMQELWIRKDAWDEPLPAEISKRWLDFCTELPQLQNLVIPRFTGREESVSQTRLIGFCDASTKAYSAVVYLRHEYACGGFKSNLLRSKTRVAPIQTISVPRLELNGALFLARLMHDVIQSWVGKLDETIYFTDSRIVLDWLAGHASTWNIYVANRVSAIQTTLPDVRWRHVPTKLNPADLNSRGVLVSDLLTSDLWWNGPSTLPGETETCSDSEGNDHLLEVSRRKSEKALFILVEEKFLNFSCNILRGFD